MTNKKISTSERKALIQQEMVLQRKALRNEILPIINAGERACHLFASPNQQEVMTKKTFFLTGTALFLALLGKRRAGWLGRAARYLIINYPGLLRKFM